MLQAEVTNNIIKAAVRDDKLAVLNKIKPIYCNPFPVKTEIP